MSQVLTRMTRAVITMALLLWSGFQSTVQAEEEHPLIAVIRKLPQVKISDPVKSTLPEELTPIIPGLKILKQQRIYLDAEVIFDQGPQDGLEAVACMPGGKNHESMLLLQCGNGALIKSLFIAHLDAADGVGSPQDSGLPARGYPIRVVLRWRPDPVMEKDVWVERDMSTLVRDRISGAAFPPLPYVYVGSRFVRQNIKDVNGVERDTELFMLDTTKTLITNYDEPDTLLASPFPLAQYDIYFEVNSADSPVEGSKVQLYFERAPLPLTLDVDATGVIYQGPRLLDDAAITDLMTRHYGAEASPGLYALGFQVAAETPREIDVQVRERALRLAAAAGVWLAPIFLPHQD